MFSSQPPPSASAVLVLADGSVLWGKGLGAHGEAGGEICFNTAMTGYQEIMTDPSYAGQIVTFTFPHIGNTGANAHDQETEFPFAKGLILRTGITAPSNYRSQTPFNEWLKNHRLTGLSGVDTRALTRHLRDHGAQNGLVHFPADGKFSLDELKSRAKTLPDMNGLDMAKTVSCRESYSWSEAGWNQKTGQYNALHRPGSHVVVVDYGVKRNILRCLAAQGHKVTVVPCDTGAEEILALKPDGIFLSNGPGDPAATGVYAVPVIKALLKTGLPLFGICLGHQMLAIALGGRTAKLPFGHRGANHPVKDLLSGQVEITSQNHGFHVLAETLPEAAEVTHVSLFDGTNEGLRVRGRPVFSLQYHPEASPGPQDSHYLFERFAALIRDTFEKDGMTDANVLPPVADRPVPFTGRLPGTPLLFGAAMFLSAACMFVMQPMLGKMLLPLVGGTPAGWIVAIAFFQLMLLAGYALAFFLARLSPRLHGLAFLGLLGLGALFLPLQLPPAPPDAEIGALLVFRLLFAAAGLPFIALAAASSTLQRLFSASGHGAARDPYFLYAGSNLGSFAGLMAYPGVIESLFNLQEQSRLWLYGYALLALLAGLCLFLAVTSGRAAGSPARVDMKVAGASPGRRRLTWIMLAFFPSSLMLGVTSYITTDLISAPLIWVLPLGLYLLTFVIAFSRRPLVPASLLEKIHPTVVAVAIALMLIINGFTPASFLAMGWQLFAFLTVALLCHLRLSAARPLEDAGRQLPDYYLMIALGGALGGLFNAFAAPLLFDRMAEYPLVLLLSCLVNPRLKSPFSFRYGALFLAGAAALAVAALFLREAVGFATLRDALLLAVLVLVTLHPRATLAAGAAIYIFTQFIFTDGDVKLTARNFFGVIRVYDSQTRQDGKTYHVRLFRHGTTTHSLQILDPGFETVPTTYFSRQGPLGDVFAAFAPQKVAVMGLGAGTIACYATPSSDFTFFELDPAVAAMARSEFSFLARCPGKNGGRVITGDARLELAKLKDEKFDLIIFDAFSSDTVPVHLISQEALALYLSHLNPRGVLVFNLSSRYVRLEDTLAAGAQAAGLANLNRHDSTLNDPFTFPSSWFVMARTEADLAPLNRASTLWVPRDAEGQRAWTDSYSSIASVVRF